MSFVPCPACREQQDRWLRYRQIPDIRIASGAAYDDTVAGVLDRQARRAAEWRETIRWQQQLIADICRKERHEGSVEELEQEAISARNTTDGRKRIMSASDIRNEDTGDEFDNNTPIGSAPAKQPKSKAKATGKGNASPVHTADADDELLDSLGTGDPTQDDDELLDSVDSSAEAWRPEEGDGIVGEVTRLGQVQSDYADQHGNYPVCPVITVRQRDGEQRRIVGYSAVLRNEINDADPQIGDTIAAKYFGKPNTRDGKRSYHSYGVKVRRASA